MLIKIKCIECGMPLKDERFRKESGFPLWYKSDIPGPISGTDYLKIINDEVEPNDIAIYFCGPECSWAYTEKEKISEKN